MIRNYILEHISENFTEDISCDEEKEGDIKGEGEGDKNISCDEEKGEGDISNKGDEEKEGDK